MSDQIELAIYYENGKKTVITIEEYQKFEASKDNEAIAKFMYGRLHSRYIAPFEEHSSNYKHKSGFAMMASYCLLVETLQSFYNGWDRSDRIGRGSRKTFEQFFQNNPQFPELKGKGSEIFFNIRCGILHQGETNGGWRITRKGLWLVDVDNKIIDAYRFGIQMDESLLEYKSKLLSEDWSSKTWENFRTKMASVIENTKL